MSYAERVKATTKPQCWGQTQSYDPQDFECSECKFKVSCAEEVQMESEPYYTPSINRYRRSSPTKYRSSYRRVEDDDVAGEYEPAQIEENEKPLERLVKDALVGGLRGIFYECFQFFKHFRIR